MDPKDLLIVEDDAPTRYLLLRAVERFEISCDVAIDGLEAMERVCRVRYRVVLADFKMPRLNGIQLVRNLIALDPVISNRPVILIMSALPPHELLAELTESIHAVIPKPFNVLALMELTRACVATRRLTEVGEEAALAVLHENARHVEARQHR